MLDVDLYARDRESIIANNHQQSYISAWHLGLANRVLQQHSFTLLILTKSSVGCCALSREGEFSDIILCAAQIKEVAKALNLLEREVAAAAILHEFAHHFAYVAFQNGNRELHCQDEYQNEKNAWYLAPEFAESLLGREVGQYFYAVRDYSLELRRPELHPSAAIKAAVPAKPVLTTEELEQQVAQIRSQLHDIEAKAVQRKAKAATKPRKASQKRDLATPMGFHSLDQYHPKITVGGSVAVFT